MYYLIEVQGLIEVFFVKQLHLLLNSLSDIQNLKSEKSFIKKIKLNVLNS